MEEESQLPLHVPNTAAVHQCLQHFKDGRHFFIVSRGCNRYILFASREDNPETTPERVTLTGPHYSSPTGRLVEPESRGERFMIDDSFER